MLCTDNAWAREEVTKVTVFTRWPEAFGLHLLLKRTRHFSLSLFRSLFLFCFSLLRPNLQWWGERVVVAADDGGQATQLRRLAWRGQSDMGNTKSTATATGPQQTIIADADTQQKGKPSLSLVLLLLLFFQCFIWSVVCFKLCSLMLVFSFSW